MPTVTKAPVKKTVAVKATPVVTTLAPLGKDITETPVAKTNGAVPVKAAKKPGKKKAVEEVREILYPDIDVTINREKEGTAMTADTAKQIIGWQEVEPSFAMLTDVNGKKIRLNNNMTNRPFDRILAKTWCSEILKGHWKFNGETMIVGKTGQVLDCQHRLSGLVLANQEWENGPEAYPFWKTAPTIDCIVVFGVDEDDETVDTINTGKPRSLADVIYRSEFFRVMEPSDREKCSKHCSYALGTVMVRTNADKDALSPRRTHADSLTFLYSHERILKCVKHCFEEEGKGKDGGRISKDFLPVGRAAGLMYFMGCAKTVPAKYHDSEVKDETKLTWGLWDKACEFWCNVAGGAAEFKHLKTAFAALCVGEQTGSINEKLALICKAWTQYLSDKPITAASLKLHYETKDDGTQVLAECPTIGGIDLGNPREDIEVSADEAEATKAEIDAEKLAAKANKTAPVKAVKGKIPVAGDYVKIKDPDGDEWVGTVKEIYTAPKKLGGHQIAKIESGGKVHEAPLTACRVVTPPA